MRRTDTDLPKGSREPGSGSKENDFVWSLLRRIARAGFVISEPILKTYYRARFSEGEYYSITPRQADVGTFYLRIDQPDRAKRRRIRGEWEPEVMKILADRATERTTFWEVGAAYGYFSLALAPHVEKVLAFEADPHYADLLRASIEKNGMANIQVVEGAVRRGTDLIEYDRPDLVCMDIEGWEFEVLEAAPELLDAETTFIVELHDELGVAPGEPTLNPEGVLDLFEQAGYRTELIDPDSNENPHYLAEPFDI